MSERSGSSLCAQDLRLRHAGKWHEIHGQLIDYGFRFYHPGLGRFINRDPLGPAGGLNPYAFLGNNPANRIEYRGLAAVPSLRRHFDGVGGFDWSFLDDDDDGGDDQRERERDEEKRRREIEERFEGIIIGEARDANGEVTFTINLRSGDALVLGDNATAAQSPSARPRVGTFLGSGPQWGRGGNRRGPSPVEADGIAAALGGELASIAQAFTAGIDAMGDMQEYLEAHDGKHLELPMLAVSGSMEYLLPGAGAVGVSVAISKALRGVLRKVFKSVVSMTRHGGLCFPAGTPVLMADGSTKPIEEVEVGDFVWSDDPEDGEPASGRRVTGLLRNWTERLVHVAVDQDGDGDADGEVRATGEHPFWTAGRGWVEAQDLQPGGVLQSADGTAPVVTYAQSVLTTCDTFNLTIAETHTYFAYAGEVPVLVHNVTPFDVGPFGSFRSPRVFVSGEPFHRHEMLQWGWLQAHGYGVQFRARNPSMALDAVFHQSVVNRLQSGAGLWNAGTLAGQSAYDNIRASIRVLV